MRAGALVKEAQLDELALVLEDLGVAHLLVLAEPIAAAHRRRRARGPSARRAGGQRGLGIVARPARGVERVERLAEALRALLPLAHKELTHELQTRRRVEALDALDGLLVRHQMEQVADGRVPALALGEGRPLGEANLPREESPKEE